MNEVAWGAFWTNLRSARGPAGHLTGITVLKAEMNEADLGSSLSDAWLSMSSISEALLSAPLAGASKRKKIRDAPSHSDDAAILDRVPQLEGLVAALVVTYNRKELVCRCLEACLAQTDPPDRVFLIDNGSTDGTKAALKAAGFLNDPRICYFAVQENIGPAAAFDQIIRLGWISKCAWMWVMDDDVIPTPSALQELKAAFHKNFAASEEVGLLASANVSGDGLANNVPEIDMRRSRGQEPGWGELLREGLIRIRWATLSSVLIPRSSIARAGSVNADRKRHV